MVVGGLRDQPTPEQLNNAWEEKRSAIRERQEAVQHRVNSLREQGEGFVTQQNTLAAVPQPGGGLLAQQSGTGLLQTGEDDVHQSPAITGGQLQAGDVVVQGLQQTGEGDVVPQNSSSYSTTRGLLNSEERLVPRQSSSQTTAGEIALRQDIKTTNGVFIWKIPDIRRRYRDAVAGRTISIYSPPFYTSPIGYKMCIRAYLNGDGIGKGTHLSLLFVIMRSDYDPFLEWPFKHSVTLSLMNQRAPSNHIVQTFKPDVESSSFARPTSDTNVASGFPKFASRSVVQDYRFSCRDVMYVKCKVHSSGLRPRGMLRPRAMST